MEAAIAVNIHDKKSLVSGDMYISEILDSVDCK